MCRSLSENVEQCSVCLVWMVYEMGSKWPYSCCFLGSCFQNLFKTAHNILMYGYSLEEISFYFIRSDFNMINNLSIGFYTFTRCMLISLSVDEMLLPRYVNCSTNFRVLPLIVMMDPLCLKHMYSVLGQEIGVLLGLVYIEVLGHLDCLHLW